MRSILVIDDVEQVVFVITMALAKYGFIVEIASDGLEGIKKFDEGRFDLVITDICMPGLNGNAVVQYVRNSEKHFTPVLGISGTPWLFGDAGFDAVLSKPFSIKELVDTVEILTAEALTSIATN